MASSSAANSDLNPFRNSQISEKLTRDNYLLWKAQVIPSVRAAPQYEGVLDGTTPQPAKFVETEKDDKKIVIVNPDYEKWLTKDQQLLSYINNSLSKEVLAQVATLTTSAAVWATLENMFSAQSRARITNLRMQMANCRKGSLTAVAYFAKMKALGDELAAAGRPVSNEELITFILAGLDLDYNALVQSVMAKTDPVTLSDLYGQILAYDSRLQMLQDMQNSGYNSSANAVARGRGGFRGRGRGGRNGGRTPPPNNKGGRQGGNQGTKPTCQICKKKGHEAFDCWYRFEEDYQPDVKTAGAASTGYGVDTNWYADSGATDHITAELEKMTVRDRYHGSDQVHTANGSGSSHEESSASRQK